MTFQTVTTILTEEDQVDTQLVAATEFARAIDAHLSALVIVTGLDQFGVMQTALDAVPAALGHDDSMKRVRAFGDKTAAYLRREDVRWNIEAVATTAANRMSEIVKQTRFSDLVVQQRAQEGQDDEALRLLAETVLFDADSPLLLLPADTTLNAPPRNIMISWDESAAALRAARQALPLMSGDTQVHVVLVDPPKDAPDRSDPGGAFAQFLSRHGVKCEVSVCNKTDDSISATLERRAQELGCDMLVMGAYGHSRLRQAIFGGTTRDILTSGQLPVFMAH